ncbi:LysR family transcriptional regulator [Paraburkholderia sp.]|uniref:LysR family transcriptional regulator n=1 Tax=Paraburkholderia sp. TaxID=1926495 RepID=UPI0039E4ED17
MLNTAYRYFYAIAEERSLRRAAERVHISASALSRQVRLLEDEFGLKLIENHGRCIVLTSAGNILREHIRQLMVQDANVKEEIRASTGVQFGHVRVGSGYGYASDLANLVIPEFCKFHPQMTFSINIGNGDSILRMVIDEIVDLGITLNPPQHHLIDVLHSSPSPLLVIVPAGHPLAEMESLALPDLQPFPIALLPPQHSVRRSIKLAEDAEGIRLQEKLESNSYEVLKSYVRHGLGISILPEFVVKEDGWQTTFALVPLRHVLLTGTQSRIIARRGRKFPAAASEFLTSILERHRAFSSDSGENLI